MESDHVSITGESEYNVHQPQSGSMERHNTGGGQKEEKGKKEEMNTGHRDNAQGDDMEGALNRSSIIRPPHP